jgi:hypothetical protein
MPIDFNRHPYYDDFNEDNQYYRLLFQPGRAVQARELTQIQTFFQNQLERLGKHIFKDGAKVWGGKIIYDRTATKWLAVKAQDIHGNPVRVRDITPGLLIRKTSQASAGGSDIAVEARITGIIPAEASDPDTIYFKWLKGEDEGFGADETLRICDAVSGRVRYTVTTLELDSQNKQRHYGTSASFAVEAGVYFWKGLFIKSTGGSVKLAKYNNTTTYRVGLAISESVDQTDPRSLDPSSHTSNYSAPGADRYKVETTLIKIGDGVLFDDRTVPNFIEIARIDTGNLLVSEDGIGDGIYSVLGRELAKRTYEESGNYIVQGYNATVKNKTTRDNPKLIAKLSEGVSYVKGNRHSLNHQNIVEVDKGRDLLTEDLNLKNDYGDNFVLVYDRASSASHPENANGLFVVGSGAGKSTADTDLEGRRGEAVSVHCVPHKMVRDHSLTTADTWNSTLVGTVRPIQMVYNRGASRKSAQAGRPGDVYSLWLGDFQSSPIANVTSVTNIITDVSATGNATHVAYMHSTPLHGITANDKISAVGSPDTNFNVDFQDVVASNTTAIVVAVGDFAGVSTTGSPMSLHRTSGKNTSPYSTLVLDENSSAAWNGSYIGASISVGNCSPRTVIDYVGTNSSAETKYNIRNGWSKRGMVIFDRPLEEDGTPYIPQYGDKYTINLTMKQARSVVYNQNMSSTGTGKYPATLNQMWDIDPITGIKSEDISLLTDEVYGNRIDGDCKYNKYGESSAGEDALLFSTGRQATKTLKTVGTFDGGLAGNTIVYYTECSIKTGVAASSLAFGTAPVSSDFVFFARPKVYPYSTIMDTSSVAEIKENFILSNMTTGEILTDNITRVVVDGADNITVHTSPNFVSGQKYVLIFTARAEFASPAYKSRIAANTSHSITVPASGDLTDFSRGQVIIADGYGTTSGSRISLLKPDGFKLHKVVHQVDNTTANTNIADSTKDVTSRFSFDSGQRDMFYDNASIVLKPDVDAPTGNLFVIFDHFTRMSGPKGGTDFNGTATAENITSPSYFSVDSYQYTTDIVFSSVSTAGFKVGQRITSNSGVSAYVAEYANNTGNYAKISLIDVTSSPSSTTAKFVADEFIKGFNPDAAAGEGATVAGKIKTIVEADLKYSEIPVYTSRGKKTYPLRNMLDFRAYVSSSTRTSDTISDSLMAPIPTRSTIRAGRGPGASAAMRSNPMSIPIKLKHFAGRIDKLVVTSDGNYKMIRGSSAVHPYPPKDDDNDKSLTLFNLEIPPYTFESKEVQIKENLARRHTMKDIGRLAKRVENLEYYVSLNALEKAASEMDVTFADGTSRFKNGILVDNFNGQGVVDIRKNGSAVGKGVMRPRGIPGTRGAYNLHMATYSDDTKHSAGIATTGTRGTRPEVVMLDYQIKPLITQPVATDAESVNPFDLQNFTGTLKITPDNDRWMDTTKIPEYNSFVNGVFDNLAGIDETDSKYEGDAGQQLLYDDIANAIKSMPDFWDDIAGALRPGDDVVGTAFHNADESMNAAEVGRNISLQGVTDQKFNTSEIDNAITTHGLTDGMIKNTGLLPYIRSRDVVIHGEGLKPNHKATVLFENVGVERYFSRANEIYLSRSGTALFQPEVDGSYEVIKLTSGSETANAVLLAVREPNFRDSKTAAEGTLIGYIVPEFNEESGQIKYSQFKDGHYDSSWAGSGVDITTHGFQGTASGRTITGYTSSAVATLTTGGTTHYYNGHFSGQARNATPNTTHIHLSPDAHRYVPNNFGDDTKLDNTLGLPKETIIKIVEGAGAGQECKANNLIYTEGSTNTPVIELVSTVQGSTGLSVAIDGTSVYTIGMRPINPNIRSHGITQVGSRGDMTNHYGEKLGTLHLPSSTRTEWTAGRKLVEIIDRYSKEEWLVSSYASAYYHAEGQEQEEVESSPKRLEMLKEVRSRLNAFRINDHPEDLGYVPAVNNEDGTEGRLAVVTGVTVANGIWTALATHAIAFVPGGGEFGTISETTQDLLASSLSGVWQYLKDEFPSIYEKYYSIHGGIQTE